MGTGQGFLHLYQLLLQVVVLGQDVGADCGQGFVGLAAHWLHYNYYYGLCDIRRGGDKGYEYLGKNYNQVLLLEYCCEAGRISRKIFSISQYLYPIL